MIDKIIITSLCYFIIGISVALIFSYPYNLKGLDIAKVVVLWPIFIIKIIIDKIKAKINS